MQCIQLITGLIVMWEDTVKPMKIGEQGGSNVYAVSKCLVANKIGATLKDTDRAQNLNYSDKDVVARWETH